MEIRIIKSTIINARRIEMGQVIDVDDAQSFIDAGIAEAVEVSPEYSTDIPAVAVAQKPSRRRKVTGSKA